MTNPELKLSIPQEMVLAAVKAQVIAALGKSEDLVAGVVSSALAQKANSYDRSTLFEQEVVKMIREVAVESFREWLTENRAKIRAEMLKQLKAQKGRVITEMVDSIMKDLPRVSASVNVRLGGE